MEDKFVFNRVVNLRIENPSIWDKEFVPAVISLLEDYVAMLKEGTAGQYRSEVYEAPDGTRLTACAVDEIALRLPGEAPERLKAKPRFSADQYLELQRKV